MYADLRCRFKMFKCHFEGYKCQFQVQKCQLRVEFSARATLCASRTLLASADEWKCVCASETDIEVKGERARETHGETKRERLCVCERRDIERECVYVTWTEIVCV